jgi:hypothetical protein
VVAGESFYIQISGQGAQIYHIITASGQQSRHRTTAGITNQPYTTARQSAAQVIDSLINSV